jgi:hypothetical protein
VIRDRRDPAVRFETPWGYVIHEATHDREFGHTKEQCSGSADGRLGSEAGCKREQIGRYRRQDRAVREGRCRESVELKKRGYTPLTIVNQLREAARLSGWLEAGGLTAGELTGDRIDEVLPARRAGVPRRNAGCCATNASVTRSAAETCWISSSVTPSRPSSRIGRPFLTSRF